MEVLEVIKTLVIPLTSVGVAVSLAWLKFYADARKRLDDLLFDLEHKIRSQNQNERIKEWVQSYPEIRKAAAELDRWLWNPLTKQQLQDAMKGFRGARSSEASITSLYGTAHEHMIDTFLMNSETVCLAPYDYQGYANRIAALRRITGSRSIESKPWPTV